MPASRTVTQVDDELAAAFMAHWELAGESRTTIAWDLETFDSTDKADFVLFELQGNGGTLAAISGGSSQLVRRFAIISAVIYVRKGKPRTRRNALTEIVMDFLETLNVAGMSVEDPGNVDNGIILGWQQVNCTAQGRYDLIRT